MSQVQDGDRDTSVKVKSRVGPLRGCENLQMFFFPADNTDGAALKLFSLTILQWMVMEDHYAFYLINIIHLLFYSVIEKFGTVFKSLC